MRIVIDLQGAQAENRNRGIGRYALSFTKAFIRNRKDIEVYVVLNAQFGESVDFIREELYELLPQQNILVWTPSTGVSGLQPEHDWTREASELVREAFIANLDPDLILISSLFEGLVDDTVTSIKMLNSSILTGAIVYDLIPLINPDPYLNDKSVRKWYETKIKHLRRSDIVLAISESSRREVIDYLGFDKGDVINISTAVDAEHYQDEIDHDYANNLKRSLGLDRGVVLYTGGIDHRKNIDGLITAYAGLSPALRDTHQLVIVCNIQPGERQRLEAHAKTEGLRPNDLKLTGYVSDDDLIALYKLCKVFVFPSLHEGFGLPALEAMSAGKAVIASNTSSLPEVVANEAALFDPYSLESITDKLTEVLTDEAFRKELEHRALIQSQSFSWDKTAIAAVEAIEQLIRKTQALPKVIKVHQRPRLAYVSPLPPARSGISDYSAELLPELAAHYQIDAIVAQEFVDTPDSNINYKVRSVAWFEDHAHLFDRVIYHFGNSTFHEHMFHLIEKFPGTVVLHDFFLSGIVANMEVHNTAPNFWINSLYHGHGYSAVSERVNGVDTADAVWRYSCNLNVLQQAQGIIVHSNYSIRLAQRWYGQNSGLKWAEIPLLRTPKFADARKKPNIRKQLGYTPEDFIVCSFGLLGPSKLNHRLLESWLACDMAKDENCHLVFVGENAPGPYGEDFLKIIEDSPASARVHITGWADAETFNAYLQIADAAVQLRSLSRGETSAAVLDCLNNGIATIVNANGSMSDIPDDSLIKLADEFTVSELTGSLNLLRSDSVVRERIGSAGQELIRTTHSPRACAALYRSSIERFYEDSFSSIPRLITSINRLDKDSFTVASSAQIADSIDKSIRPSIDQRQLLVDISELVKQDAKSGIQRVVRNILAQWLNNPPAGYRVEPVYATTEEDGYRYAREFTLNFLDCPSYLLIDEPVTYHSGDKFIGLDLQPHVVPRQHEALADMRRRGVTVQFVVYDLLLKKLAHCFVEGAAESLDKWLATVINADGAICISKAVADELAEWVGENAPPRQRPFDISWFHLGADIASESKAVKSTSLPKKMAATLASRPSFLMVGTIEPRKAHAQVLEAFSALWAAGKDVNLLIVGKKGWLTDGLIKKIESHRENGKRLFWLDAIDDAYLSQLYARCSALIAASLGEGFGLPLIEAAQHGVPLIVRDIPVFKEVAGDNAWYFSGETGQALKDSLIEWLALYQKAEHPISDKMAWLTWKESAEQLFAASQIAR
jgi:glycosyltransferase involved in cell wall biosynthesis